MVDIKSPKCILCKKKQPSFNYEGEVKATHCGGCSLTNMVDIKSPKCNHPNCNTRASYGYCGQNKTKCAKHHIKNKMFVNSKRKCLYNDCKEIAIYGKTDPNHCILHIEEDEICLIGKKCMGCCRDDEILDNEGLCLTFCCPEKISKYTKKIVKIKEIFVLKYLDENVKTIYKTEDNNRSGGKVKHIDSNIIENCNKHYVDRIYDCETHYVIVEIDEHAHRGYDKRCVVIESEKARMHNTQFNYGLPCIFIRFNPDNFKVGGKKQNYSMSKRLVLLVKWVEKCFKMKPKKEIEPVKSVYLFYDEFDEGYVKINFIDDVEICKKQIGSD